MTEIKRNEAAFIPTELPTHRTVHSKTFSKGAGKYRALQSAVPIHAFDAEKQEWREIDARFRAVEGDRFQSVGSCLTTICDSSGIEIRDTAGNRLAWNIEGAKTTKPEVIVEEPEKDEADDYALSVFRQAERNAEGLILYKEIFPGVDMTCRTGFRFYDAFTFASPEAIRDITFFMETGELSVKQEKNGMGLKVMETSNILSILVN